MSKIECECSGAGFCERRKVNISGIHVRLCQSGRAELVDKLYADLSVKSEVQKRRRKKDKSKIGTYLKEIFKREYDAKACDKCVAAMHEINQKSLKEVEEQEDKIINDIAHRAKTKSPKLWQRIGARVDAALHLGIVKGKVKKHLKEAIERERRQLNVKVAENGKKVTQGKVNEQCSGCD